MKLDGSCRNADVPGEAGVQFLQAMFGLANECLTTPDKATLDLLLLGGPDNRYHHKSDLCG